MSFIHRRGAASRLALAFALSTAAAVAVAAPAQAAKPQEQQPAEAKAQLSKGFMAVYKPFYELLKAKGDILTLKGNLPALQAAAQSPDDKYTAGQTIYSIGAKSDDIALQRQGVEMMIASGSKLAGADHAQQIFAAAQLAYQAKDWASARTRAQEATAAGYTGDTDLLVAETFFAEDQATAGIDALDKAIARKTAAGQTVPQDWIKRGIAMAYNAKLAPQTAKLSADYVRYYPSLTSWGDAINIRRNLFDYDGQELVDLMRLAQRVGTLKSQRDYYDYISAADARRSAFETQKIIKAGQAAGVLKAGDPFVTEANSVSSGRLAADLADLPKLAQAARAPNATAVTALAAADMHLGYDKAAEAEALYQVALGKPGVDTGRALTRLGIAQFEQGKFAEAKATFDKVEGPRLPIAQLWSIYAAQSAKGPAAATAQ
jgi:hypothetical protein